MAYKVVTNISETIAPLPKTTRGFGIHIDGTVEKKKRLLYCNGKFVIVRSLENQFSASLFSGHKSNVNVAKFSPNGEWVASGDSTGIVIIWGAENQSVKNEIKVSTSVLDISWAGDNSQIIAMGEGGGGIFGRVFRIDSTNSIGEISGHSKKILSCAIKPSKPFFLATASEDLLINVYKGIPYKHAITHRLHKNYPNCIRFDRSGDRFASVGSDKKIIIFSGEGQMIKTIDENHKGNHKGSIYSCCFSPDGSKLLTASSDKSSKIWDVETAECETTFSFGTALKDMQVACLWIEGFIISISLSGDINFLEMSSTKIPKNIWTGHQACVNSLVTLPNESKVFSGDSSGQIVCWCIDTKESICFNGKGHSERPVVSMALNADKTKIFSVGFDDNLCEGGLEGYNIEPKFHLSGQPTGLATGHKNPNLIAISTSKNLLYFCDNENLNFNKPLELVYKPTCLAFASDDSILAVGGDNNMITIYTVSSNCLELNIVIKEHTDPINFVAFSENGDYLVTVGTKNIYLWDTHGNYSEPLNTRGWPFHDGKVTGACFSEDFEKIATCGKDAKIIVWSDIKKGNSADRRIINPAHITGVNVVSSYKGEVFVSTGDDKCIRLWSF